MTRTRKTDRDSFQYVTGHVMSHVNKNEINMKTIGVEITPDQHNLIGTSCLKKFPNWDCGQNSQAKKLLIQRNTQECVGL